MSVASPWLLPERIADIAPPLSWRIESARRSLLDAARGKGFELVIPPLLEFADSLLPLERENRSALEAQSFRLTDQVSGRTLALRADTTLQAARMDAHYFSSQQSGVGTSSIVRLCYCGPVLHAASESVSDSREPLQFGAELYGEGSLAAEHEILALALDCAALLGAERNQCTLDLNDARIARALLQAWPDSELPRANALARLSAKDAAGLAACLPEARNAAQRESRAALLQLCDAYGEIAALGEVAKHLPRSPGINAACNDLVALGEFLRATAPDLHITFDLAEQGGWQYYSAVSFALYAPHLNGALLRGGRYDQIGATFAAPGKGRAACGFSLDIKAALLTGRS